jgi:hypothetical protein
MPEMLEVALVALAVLAMGFTGSLGPLLTSTLLTVVGIGTLFLGLVVGVPAGFWYHVILYRFVSKKIRVPGQWWIAPARFHRHLTEAEERRIEPWYLIGGVGFALSVAGGFVAIAGLLARG